MVKLTTELSEQLRREEQPRIVANDEEFVLVRSEVYEQIKGLIEEPEEIDESLYEAEDLRYAALGSVTNGSSTRAARPDHFAGLGRRGKVFLGFLTAR